MKQRYNSTLHDHILDDIQGKIVSGIWPPGFRLPFEIDLAAHYNCSRMTVNKVMTQLVANGMIERRRKSGSFVRMPQNQPAILAINEISTEIAALKLPYTWRILAQEQRRSTEDDKAYLKLSAGTPVLALTCLHFADNRPFCLEQRLINLDSVPQALKADFNTQPPGNWLVAMIPWSEAENKISAIVSDHTLAATLEIAQGSPCLLIERHTSNNGASITAVRLAYPAARHSITAHFKPVVS